MPSGFLFTINGGSTIAHVTDAVASCVERGMYSTLVNINWRPEVASTLGDYINIKPGDNVYFFGKRMIFGIGEVVDAFGSGEGAFALHPDASSLHYNPPTEEIVVDRRGNRKRAMRWAIIFKGAPCFFTEGIDMDELLLSNPSAFKSLRTFQKRSFIQFDDAENSAFKAAIIRKNESTLENGRPNPGSAFTCNYVHTIQTMSPNFQRDNGPCPIDLRAAIKATLDGDASSQEMIVEDAILDALKRDDKTATEAMGHWDYLSHQVPASPFKPIDYMDRIDIFGYRWIPGYEGEIVSKYLVVEVKRGPASISDSSGTKDYDQLMKYVDWVCTQYAHGDYSMIEAYLVASSFDFSNCTLMQQATTRSYVIGHLATTRVWNNFVCVQYRASDSGSITFEKV